MIRHNINSLRSAVPLLARSFRAAAATSSEAEHPTDRAPRDTVVATEDSSSEPISPTARRIDKGSFVDGLFADGFGKPRIPTVEADGKPRFHVYNAMVKKPEAVKAAPSKAAPSKAAPSETATLETAPLETAPPKPAGIQIRREFANDIKRIRDSDAIDEFFEAYTSFKYDRQADFWNEYIRLSEFMEWERDSPVKHEAWQRFRKAMVASFPITFSYNVDDVKAWRKICYSLRLVPVPTDMEACKKVCFRAGVGGTGGC